MHILGHGETTSLVNHIAAGRCSGLPIWRDLSVHRTIIGERVCRWTVVALSAVCSACWDIARPAASARSRGPTKDNRFRVRSEPAHVATHHDPGHSAEVINQSHGPRPAAGEPRRRLPAKACPRLDGLLARPLFCYTQPTGRPIGYRNGHLSSNPFHSATPSPSPSTSPRLSPSSRTLHCSPVCHDDPIPRGKGVVIQIHVLCNLILGSWVVNRPPNGVAQRPLARSQSV